MSLKISIKNYSRSTSKGAISAELFGQTIGDLFKKLVFEAGNFNWIDQIHEITKQYTNEKPSATKLSQLRASSRMKRGYVHNNFSHKRKRIRPKCKMGFFWTANEKKNF